MSARKDPKIVELIDKHGTVGYFHYFVLLEMCATVASDEFPADSKFNFHPRNLSTELQCRRNKLKFNLGHLEDVLLINLEWTENNVCVHLPNFSKYMGFYKNKSESNSSNEIKRKEIKEKERKGKGDGGKEAAATTELFNIPEKLMRDLKMLEQYPEKIITEVAKEAWLLYNASSDPKKDWSRFSAAYFRNEKQKIRERILNDPDEARERMIKKYEGSQYEF